MIARIRGEHDARWGRWRPGAGVGVAIAPSRRIASVAGRPDGDTGALRHRVPWRPFAVGALIPVACAQRCDGASRPGPSRPQLPATPRAWLDAYEAAAIDNPPRVCSELFSPALAQAYGKAVRGRCTSYFEQITSFSVVVWRVLQDGDTAVLELRQTLRPRDNWAVVLNRAPAGWRAVDLLPAG